MKRILLLVSGFLSRVSPVSAIIDTNENGLSDLWEKAHNNNELFSSTYDPQADSDQDGWTNAEEAAAGTDPADPNPPDGLVRPDTAHIPATYYDPDEDGIPDVLTPETITLTWPTIPGKKYTLLVSSDLSPGSWLPCGQDSTFIGNGNQITYGFPTGVSARSFWRIKVEDADTDGDTLTDAEEHSIGSSPYLADTDGDGVNDNITFANGGNPAGDGSDTNGDGVPDNEIYSVEFEVQEEWKELFPGVGLPALSGDTSQKRYLTSTHSDEYSIVESPRYAAIPSGLHKSINTWLSGGVLTAAAEADESEEGTTHDDWMTQNPVVLGDGESIVWSATVTTTTGPTTTADERYTTTTKTTPWEVKNGGNTIRQGTEIITLTDRLKLTDDVTYPQLWTTHFKPRAWVAVAPTRYGPPEISPTNLQYVQDKAAAAESIRQSYRISDFNVSGNISVAGGRQYYYDLCVGARLKSVRWRWVRFDPNDPFSRHPAEPPASMRKRFSFLVKQSDGGGTVYPLTYATGTEKTVGIVNLDCDGTQGGSGWQELSLGSFNAFRKDDPTTLEATTFAQWSITHVGFGNLPIFIQKRIPDIADDGGATTYTYQTVGSVPRETPLPGVEITTKDIEDDTITLTAEIYDALADVMEAGETAAPKLWVNSREQPPTAGDKPGVYRLVGHAYQLYPGRNEITVAVENALGGRGSETIVVEGDNEQGYQISGEPVRTPLYPTYPLLLETRPESDILPGDRTVTLAMAGRSAPLPQGTDNDGIPSYWFRSKPFISVLKPASATSAQVAALPAGKPVFLAELDDNLSISIGSSEWAAPAEWAVFQSGTELITPKSIEITETGSHAANLQIKARGFGQSPALTAKLVTYKNDEMEQDVTSAFTSAYQTAYAALAADAKNGPVTFTVNDFQMKEGCNLLTFDFADSQLVRHNGCHHSFRYPAPTISGVRVFSANRKKDTVLDGITSRPQDIWYPVATDVNLSGFADALIASGCQVVGMTDLNGCFEDAPLKRSFLVRGPPGRTFQAFDQLYAAQGRSQRSQTFDADGTHGATLAGELDRVQSDEELPSSAKNALGVEIAKTYQFHNGFEDLVPKTHQAYVDPGTGVPQPNSWTMRGSSLPDHLQSNPTPWTVTSTLSDPIRATSTSGKVKIDTTAENSTYYATTSATAPWNLAGARAVAMRFKLLSHDDANGPDGAFQLAAGDGTRTWTCQVAPAQIKVQGTTIALPAAKFPAGLIDGKFHTLRINLSGTGNDAIVSIDGEVLTATAVAQTGTLNGIAFGDPGAGISGKIETETLNFENSELRYQYGIYDADEYADSDEIESVNNVLLYLRSKGQEFRTSAVARWVKILDPRVYEWLLEKYTGKREDGAQQQLHILANKDVWFGSIVDMDVDTDVGSPLTLHDSKVTNTLVLDSEETKIWSTDQTRNEMQLAGILMAWVYQQNPYKSWLASLEGRDADALLIEKKHLVENIVKCAKRVETTLEVGGEIAVCMTNEYADYAITIKDISQGEYMAMVGFIPLLPSSTAKMFKFVGKTDGATIEAIHQLSTKLDDFPAGRHEFPNANIPGNTRTLDFSKIFANADDVDAVMRARSLTTNDFVPNGGTWTGRKLLDTFSNSNVAIFKTKQPIKAYRCFSSNPNISEWGASGGFLMFEQPIHRTQVEVDYALGTKTEGFFCRNSDGTSAYDRFVEVEIPEGVYIYLGISADQGADFRGGGTQIWVDTVTRDAINWNVPWMEIPQY